MTGNLLDGDVTCFFYIYNIIYTYMFFVDFFSDTKAKRGLGATKLSSDYEIFYFFFSVLWSRLELDTTTLFITSALVNVHILCL